MARVSRVVSPLDPRLLDYTIVKERDLLRDRGVFVAEGKLVVSRLLLPACRFHVRSMLVLEQRLNELLPLAELRGDFPVYVADRPTMDAIVGFRFHQGCLAVGALDTHASAASVLDALPAGRRTVVVLEDLVDLDNVGSVFRNAAALGADAVLLSPRSADPMYRKAIRTSMGHALLLPWARFDIWPEGLDTLRTRGFALLALTPAPDAEPIAAAAARLDAAPLRGVALMLGAEGDGLSPAALRAADARVRIPMANDVDSINIATAAAVALHRFAPSLDPRP